MFGFGKLKFRDVDRKVVSDEEQVGSLEELPPSEVGEEIWLVARKDHNMSQYFSNLGSSVRRGQALRSSPMLVTGRLEVLNRPDPKYRSSTQSIIPQI